MKQLQSHQYPEIGRQMGLTPEEVSHHLEIIKRLDPKPGLKYSPDRSTYVIPDVFVVKEGDDYKIVLNDDGLPKLRISPTYKRMLDDKEPGSRGDAQLREGQAAQRALAAEERGPAAAHDLQGRRSPSCATSAGFLDHGIDAPAAAGPARRGHRHRHARVHGLAGGGQQVHAHARAGVYEMRFFFHSGITSNMGEAVSSVTIKDKIRKMIEAEDAVAPALRLAHRRAPGQRRPAPGPPHGGQVPRGAAHPALEPAQGGPLTTGVRRTPRAGRWPHEDRVHRPADRGAAQPSRRPGRAQAPEAGPASCPGITHAHVDPHRGQASPDRRGHRALAAPRPAPPARRAPTSAVVPGARSSRSSRGRPQRQLGKRASASGARPSAAPGRRAPAAPPGADGRRA